MPIILICHYSRIRESMDFSSEFLYGKNMTIVDIWGHKFFIGVQVAKLLRRETFNLYRSLKISGTEIIRCNPGQLELMLQLNKVKRGTRSVTLLSYDNTLAYIAHQMASICHQEIPEAACTKLEALMAVVHEAYYQPEVIAI